MKKLLLSLASCAFAATVFAVDKAACPETDSCCCAPKSVEQTKAGCPYKGKTGRKTGVVKKVLKSPKAAAEFARK